jgi:hypothetical protein
LEYFFARLISQQAFGGNLEPIDDFNLNVQLTRVFRMISPSMMLIESFESASVASRAGSKTLIISFKISQD